MNKARRKVIQEIHDKIVDLKDSLDDIISEEEEYRDNIPENMQGSDKYAKVDEACDALHDAITNLEDAVDNLNTAME